MINKHNYNRVYERFFKRIIDVIISIISLILLFPVFVLLGVLIKYKIGSPIIFKQERPGKNEKNFFIYKFRTMSSELDINGQLLPDEQRLNRFGKALRSTSLDELPELWNILIGDMSIVGPRPLLKEYIPWYTIEERSRHNVRPGLTGLAQVNGRNAISWDKKLNYDLEYVSNITFKQDFKIFLKTFNKVFKRSDIKVGKEFTAGSFIVQRKEVHKQQGGGSIE